MATCAGCDKKDTDFSCFGKDNPVTEDGSYANGKFVCDSCYVALIELGQDVGSATELQRRAEKIFK